MNSIFVVSGLLLASFSYSQVKVVGGPSGGKAKGCGARGCGAVKVAEAEVDRELVAQAFLESGSQFIAESGLPALEQAALYIIVAELRAEGFAGTDRDILAAQ
jgi:hypothetical protein